MTLTIRPASDSDREAAQRLLTAQLVEHRLPADPERVARGIQCAFDCGAWLWMAERDGQAVAIFLANQIASVERGGIALWVEELYVVPEARRAGIARALLTRVREEALRRGFRGIDLEVVPSQAAAFALYRALGFRDVDRRRMSLEL